MRKENKMLTVFMLVSILIVSLCALAYADPINLRFVFPGTSDVERNYCDTLVKDFNSAYEGKINVTAEYIGWSDVMLKVIAMAQAGSPPDMLWTDTGRFSEIQAMGYLQDIDEWASNWEDLKFFYPFLLDQFTCDGKLYSIPTMAEYVLTGGHIRVDKIKALYGDPESIKTWDDWLKACEVLHEKDIDNDGKIDTYAVAMPPSDVLWILQSLARNNGNMYIKDALDPGKKDAWIEIFDFWQKLSKYNIPGIESMDYKDCQRAFAAGLVCFDVFTGSWMYGNIADIAPDILTPEKVGIMVGPIGPSHQGEALSGAQPYGPFIFKDIPEENKKAAWEFIKFHASKENAARFPGFMHLPARTDVSLDDVIKYSPYGEKYKWYLDLWIQVADMAVPREQLPGLLEIQDLVQNIYLELMSDDINAVEAYDRFVSGLKEIWGE